MKNHCVKILAGILLVLSLQSSGLAAGFRWPIGITFSQGSLDAIDRLDDLYTAAGFDFDRRFVVPLGLTFAPYYEFDNGIGLGLNLGPTSFIVIGHNSDHNDWDNSDLSYIIPVGADIRYTFMHDQDVAPYGRVGIRYPIVGGPNLTSSQPGPFGAIGVEFWRTRKVGMGVEAGYDASQLKVRGPDGDTKRITFAGFVFSVFITF